MADSSGGAGPSPAPTAAGGGGGRSSMVRCNISSTALASNGDDEPSICGPGTAVNAHVRTPDNMCGEHPRDTQQLDHQPEAAMTWAAAITKQPATSTEPLKMTTSPPFDQQHAASVEQETPEPLGGSSNKGPMPLHQDVAATDGVFRTFTGEQITFFFSPRATYRYVYCQIQPNTPRLFLSVYFLCPHRNFRTRLCLCDHC